MSRPKRRRPANLAELEKSLSDAMLLLGEGTAAQARTALRQVLHDAQQLEPRDRAQVGPLCGTAWLGLGDIAEAAGRRNEAVGYYRRAARLRAVPPPVLRLLAQLALTEHDRSDEAAWYLAIHIVTAAGGEDDPAAGQGRQLCRPPPKAPFEDLVFAERVAAFVMRAEPSAEWAWMARADALLRLARPVVARHHLVAAERAVPGAAAISLQLGLLDEQAGDLDQARDAFRRAAAAAPSLPEPRVALGRVCLALAGGDPANLAEAVTSLHEAARLAPNQADVWHQLGLALARTDPVAAREPMTTAAELDPHNAGLHHDRAALMERLGDTAEAITSWQAVLSCTPSDTGAAVRLGALLTDVGRPCEAEAVLVEALRIDPYDRGARYELGRGLLITDRPHQAVSVLSALDDRTPEEGHLLARAHARDGALSAAVDELEQRLCLPGLGADRDRALTFTLGRVHARRRAWNAAMVAFEHVRSIPGADPPDLALYTGIVCRHTGALDAARDHLDAARASAPSDPRPHYARGMLAIDLDDDETAAEAFAAALSVAPDHQGARLGLGLVAERRGDPESAADHYGEGLRDGPAWWPATARLATIALTADRVDHALELLGPVVEGGARWLDDLRASALARSGDHGAALAIWEGLRSGEDPDGLIAHNVRVCHDHLGCAAAARGDHAEAVRHWEACQALAPEAERYEVAVADARLRLAAARIGTPDAVWQLREAARRVPDDPRVPYLAAVIGLAEGVAEPAAAVALDVLAARGSEHAAYHLALLDATAGRAEAAPRRLDDPAWRGSGLSARCGLLRAVIEAGGGRFREALSAFIALLDEAGPDERIVAGVVRCAAELGAASEAIASLVPFCPTHPSARRFVGLLRFVDGAPEAALDVLPPRPGPDEPAWVRDTVVAAHVDLAGRAAAAGDFRAAATSLGAAVSADPASTAGLASLAAEWEAWAAAGDPEGVSALWTRRLERDPGDVVALQHLAVLYRRQAQDGHPVDVDMLMACWAALLHSPAFWVALQARTRRAVADDDRAAARRRLSDEVVRILRDVSERSGQATTVYDVTWGLELRTAQAVAHYDPQARGIAEWPAGLACGPFLLDWMARHADGGRAAANSLRAMAAAGTDGPSRHLNLLLGPLGRHQYLIDDGNAEDAVDELLAWPRSAEGTALLGEAHLAVALARAKEGAWGDAVAAFVEAHGRGADVGPHIDLIKQAAMSRVRELRGSAEVDAAQASVDLLESVRPALARDPAFDAEVAAMATQLALRLNNSDDYEGAVRWLRRALELTPADPTARKFAVVAMQNLAQQLLQGGSSGVRTRAFALVAESVPLTDGDRGKARAQACLALVGAAQDLEQAEDIDAAIEVLREALRHDADNVACLPLARLLTDAGRPDDGVEVLRDAYARQADPELGRALAIYLHNQAVRYGNARQYPAAIAAARSSLQIEDDPPTRELLAALLSRTHGEEG